MTERTTTTGGTGGPPLRIACFGELLLRLGAPGRERLLQTPGFDVHVGGAEANVAVSLARFGHDARMLTTVPANALGDAALAELRRQGVDTSHARRGAGRMGLYFLESGAGARASTVLYDRAGSAFALAPPESYDWARLLAGVDALHLSGVTPALGSAGAAVAIAAARAARELGLGVSFDGNYRQTLWQAWDGDPRAILPRIAASANTLFADPRDVALLTGHVARETDPVAAIAEAAHAAFAAFPAVERVATTVRTARDVDHHELGAVLVTRTRTTVAPARATGTIVDRIGGGDAFAAGLLHGVHAGMGDERALAYALAAACLKHSVPGDANLCSVEDVLALLEEPTRDVRR
ncbi:MAG TPA: sugar kinase [Xanthomonadales bacterium]|nr:sugar kinase [Xanthomonadales bacterium]